MEHGYIHLGHIYLSKCESVWPAVIYWELDLILDLPEWVIEENMQNKILLISIHVPDLSIFAKW